MGRNRADSTATPEAYQGVTKVQNSSAVVREENRRGGPDVSGPPLRVG